MKRIWTIIGVRDVQASFTWYQSLFGHIEARPAHDHFGQILDLDGTVLLCLHQWGAHEHPSLMSSDAATPGNGLLLFFRVDDFDTSLTRARTLVARLDEEPNTNPNTQTREFSLRDPDGYFVTISELTSAQPGSQAVATTKPGSRVAKPSKVRKGENVGVLLAGGNPQIAKADGDAPVQAYIAAMPGWKHELGKRLDALIVRSVPSVKKTVKWNSPFYGIAGQGWFVSFHVFTRYVKVTFFRGTSLRPLPPGGTARSKDARWIDIHEGDQLDEAQMTKWAKQAAALPGWTP
jgi:predicted enzyme related to lactoylglutathione lyase